MGDLCYKHGVNAPVTHTCPQCEIAALNADLQTIILNDEREWVRQNKVIVKYREGLERIRVTWDCTCDNMGVCPNCIAREALALGEGVI